jgi:2-polyprenyl-3-methyl-5-hydroxy-6-metoxy-1,4-benzoquinol methylase
MQERHSNRLRYFNEQSITTGKYVIPYIEQSMPVGPGVSVLEIGCGEGGNLPPFLERGCKVTGVDIVQSRIECAQVFLAEHAQIQNLTLLCNDIYNLTEKDGKYDIIIMRDVIEHIHNQEKFMGFVKQFMNDNAVFFLAFPPWYNPFGGHQQICKSKFLSKLPYFHILPAFMYKAILKAFGESQKTIDDLLEIKQTGITIDRFERIVSAENYRIEQRTLYFINPNYETKFGLKPRVQLAFISVIPFVRNFFITAGYYLLKKK